MPEETSSSGLAGRIKSMSVGALVVSAVVILVVGLVVGLAAGYKIEQQRVKNDNKKSASNAKEPSGANASSAGTVVRLAGKVDAAAPDSVTLTVDGKNMKVLTTPKTIVVKASPGAASDVTTDSRVVWKPVPGQLAQAQEIIVLPATAKLGSQVTSTTPDSMTIKSNGKNVTISTKGASVLKVATAKLSDVTTGGKVVAQTRKSPTGLAATEVIVLPSSSKFVE